MNVAAVGFLVGAAVLVFIPSLPAIETSVLILASGFAVSVLKPVSLAGWIAIGFGLASIAGGSALSDRLAHDLAGRDILLIGIVTDLPRGGTDALQFIFEGRAAMSGQAIPSRIRLSWYNAPTTLVPGDRWQLLVRLRPPAGSSNPGGFDYERWLLHKRIGALGYVRRSNRNKRLEVAAGNRLTAYRFRLSDQITELGRDNPFTGVLKALAIGYRGGMSPNQSSVFRDTGAGHLLAISGLHVGIAALLGIFLARCMWVAISVLPGKRNLAASRKSFSISGGLIVAFLYAALAGFSLPTARALIMLCVIVLFALLRRRPRSGQACSLALLLILSLDPLAVLSAGFWLSFVAVAGLIIGFSGLVRRQNSLAIAVRSQLLIWIVLVVPTLLFFGGISLISPVLNLLLVPFFSFLVVPVALSGMLLIVVLPVAAELCFEIVFVALDLIWPGLEWLAESAWTRTRPARAPLLVILVALGGLVLFALPRLVGRFVLPLLILPAMSWTAEPPAPGNLELAVLDVGQGLAVVVRTHRRILVFDAGPAWYGGGNAGSRILVPFLRRRGIEAVDMLIVSHGDNDHRGGAAGLLQEMPVDRIVAGPGVDIGTGGVIERCHDGFRWQWDGIDFHFLNPPGAVTTDSNDSSCVLKLAGRNIRALLAGDIEKQAEDRLISSGHDLRADVVVAPHHGSKTSSGHRFVRVEATAGGFPGQLSGIAGRHLAR
jgi:competence protein ComEC